MRKVLLWSLMLISVQAWAAELCWRETLQSLFPVEPYQGQLLEPKRAKAVLPSDVKADEVRFLGQGGQLSEVYRVRIGSETKILKKVNLRTALNDESAFHLIREAAEGQSEVHVVTSKLYPVDKKAPHSLGRSTTWMEIQDVKGRSLFSVLNDPQLPKEVRTRLVQRYDSFLDHVRKNLNKKRKIIMVRRENAAEFFPAEIPSGLSDFEKWEFTQHQPKSLYGAIPVDQLSEEFKPFYQMLKKVSGDRIRLFEAERSAYIFLKSDNFIVTPDYDLYLIDPF